MDNTTEMDITLNSGSHYLNNVSKNRLQTTGTFKKMILLTVCLYIVFFCFGLVVGLTAPSFLNLVELYNTDVSGMSVIFTFMSAGYLLGSCTCAFLFDKASHELQYFLLSVLEAAFTILIPLLPRLYPLFAVAFLQNLTMAYIDASGHSYIIRLWENHKVKEPLLIGVHAIWSLGAFISPFIVSPFLVDLPQSGLSSNHFNNTTEYNVPITENVTVSENVDITSHHRIKYPYIITGSVVGISSVFCLVCYCLYGDYGLTRSKNTCYHKQKHFDSLSFKIPMLIMQFLFFFLYPWYQLVLGTLLPTFVIEGLNWSIHDGPLLMSVYWGFNGVGRIVHIPISFCMKPLAMLCINIGICVCGHFIMLIAVLTNDKLLWISTAMIGFSMGTLFSFALLWISQYMYISGAMAGFFLISISIGGMTGPALTGFLFEYSSHMWVVYLSLMASVTEGMVFLMMFVFVKIHKGRMKTNAGKTLQAESEAMHTSTK